ncbi:MAG: MarR family winged helix-turn-helix transcriptional regulator [Flavisolibacter sp.]
MEKIEGVIFYALDKSIKTYRQYAQKRFYEEGLDITVDQWLVLSAIADRPDISQLEIAEKVFKDAASITRIIDLLIRKNYLQRESHPADRRRFSLALTTEGKTVIRNMAKIVEENRARALKGIPEKDLQQMKQVLHLIIDNCKQ